MVYPAANLSGVSADMSISILASTYRPISSIHYLILSDQNKLLLVLSLHKIRSKNRESRVMGQLVDVDNRLAEISAISWF